MSISTRFFSTVRLIENFWNKVAYPRGYLYIRTLVSPFDRGVVFFSSLSRLTSGGVRITPGGIKATIFFSFSLQNRPAVFRYLLCLRFIYFIPVYSRGFDYWKILRHSLLPLTLLRLPFFLLRREFNRSSLRKILLFCRRCVGIRE